MKLNNAFRHLVILATILVATTSFASGDQQGLTKIDPDEVGSPTITQDPPKGATLAPQKGDKGDPGTNGTNGTNGRNGRNGGRGPRGYPGKPGPQGPAGPAGKNGLPGVPGPVYIYINPATGASSTTTVTTPPPAAGAPATTTSTSAGVSPATTTAAPPKGVGGIMPSFDITPVIQGLVLLALIAGAVYVIALLVARPRRMNASQAQRLANIRPANGGPGADAPWYQNRTRAADEVYDLNVVSGSGKGPKSRKAGTKPDLFV